MNCLFSCDVIGARAQGTLGHLGHFDTLSNNVVSGFTLNSFCSRPVMPICGVFRCSNRPGVRPGVKFYKTPKLLLNQGEETRNLSEERRRLWKAAINRSDIQTESQWDRTPVCSDHFVNMFAIFGERYRCASCAVGKLWNGSHQLQMKAWSLRAGMTLTIGLLCEPWLNGCRQYKQFHSSCSTSPTVNTAYNHLVLIVFVEPRRKVPKTEGSSCLLDSTIGVCMHDGYENRNIATRRLPYCGPSITWRNCGKAGVLCISISGSAVRAASLLLDSDVSSFEQAENQLRGTALEPTPTLAFMFSCVGRGQMYYDRLFNVEADAFHRVYPKTPLFGFFGNGECGRSRNVWNLPGTSNSKDGSQDGSSQKLLHSFTTAFAFLHFGEPVLMARCTVDDNHLTTK
uniref:F-box only protein 22 isoform X3 n=1 Tax=Myxine glutinosa TaxID=7769 RepID=UPI00358E431D